MTENNLPIRVTALRAEDYSRDGQNLTISLATKYSNVERKYSVPIECLYDFITDLKRLNANAGGARRVPEHPAMPRMTADEHQASCFALEEEKGEGWKGSGATELVIKEAKSSL